MSLAQSASTPPIGEPAPPPTAVETRLEALVTRMNALARVAGGGSIGRELADIAAELRRVRRDVGEVIADLHARVAQLDIVRELADALGDDLEHVAGVVPPRRAYTARAGEPARRSTRGVGDGRTGGKRKGMQLINGHFVIPPKGKRWCQAHGNGAGAMLPKALFKVKNPRTGALTSWCTECTRNYQQARYVRIGFKRVIAELRPGDPAIGHACSLCGHNFKAGERVAGSAVAHERCLDARDEATA